MNYPNVEFYLNEEYRKPIKRLLQGHRVESRVMEYVDDLCNENRELRALIEFLEETNDIQFKPRKFLEFLHENKTVDFDLLDEYLDEWED